MQINRFSIFASIDRDGALRFVGDVPRGLRLPLRGLQGATHGTQGAVKQWYFAHEGRSIGVYSPVFQLD